MLEDTEDSRNKIKADIDADKGLLAKRKLLLVASFIMLSINFLGVTIEEANTFILKLKFEHQNGLRVVILAVIFGLMIRYYGYCDDYRKRLYLLWSSHMLKDHYFYHRCPNHHRLSGIVAGLMPKFVSSNAEETDNLDFSWEARYERRLFSRYILFTWTGENSSPEDCSSRFLISRKCGVLLKIYWYEIKHQITNWFVHRETLDIYLPYLIATAAIASYFLKGPLGLILAT